MNDSDATRIGVLVSGNGSNLQALIDAIRIQGIPATLVLVVSNRPNALALERASKHGIPTAVIDHQKYADRQTFDQALLQVLDHQHLDLIVLAGFMRILTPPLVEHFLGRMLNVHPALLPAYPGLHTHARALADRVHRHGASVHFVIPELDAGPVVLQGEVPVFPDDEPQRLAARVQQMEHIIYPQTVDWFARKRLYFQGGKAWLDDHPLIVPSCIHLDGYQN